MRLRDVKKDEEYILAPNSKTFNGGTVYFDPTVTRVRYLDNDGDNAHVKALDGVGRRGEGYDQYVGARYLTPAVVKPRQEVTEAHKADMEIISNRLHKQSISDAWCSEYLKVRERLNRNLAWELPEPKKRLRGYALVRVPIERDLTEEEESGDGTAIRRAEARRISAAVEENGLDGLLEALKGFDADKATPYTTELIVR